MLKQRKGQSLLNAVANRAYDEKSLTFLILKDNIAAT
jgi:hypothetical protein